MADQRPVGIFDSGLGGLTVAAAVRKLLPQENIVYLGDTARVPYGNRSPETIRSFAADDMRYLAEQNVKIAVAACNTVSATALDLLQTMYPAIPVQGVIESGAAAAAKNAEKCVLVLGTRATISSGAYVKALRKYRDEASLTIRTAACPLFVPLAEEGILNGTIVQETLNLYLQNVQLEQIDTILLGCTHYPLLAPAIREYTANNVRIIDSAAAAASALKTYLTEHNLAAERKTGALSLSVTDINGGFRTQAERFLGTRLPDVNTVSFD